MLSLHLDNHLYMENLKYNKIKVALAERDLSNKWLANKLGKTEMTVSRWVSNKCQPTIESIYKIAFVLEMEAKDLLSPIETLSNNKY